MKLLITIVVLFSFSSLFAQNCGSFTVTDRLVQGNLQFDILNGPDGFNNLKYKVDIGDDGDLDSREYTSIIKSMNTWAGGVDPNQNLKMALGIDGLQDWSPGPLNESGQTSSDVCLNWDRVFTVTKEEIIKSIEIFQNQGPCSDIPEAVLNWPGRNNTNLPFPTNNVSADFWDENSDGDYDPCAGDFPYISTNGSFGAFSIEESYNYMPSQISYYVMNDNGKPHDVANSAAIQMQVSTHIFSFNIPQLEDVIFMKRRIDNKATDDIRSYSIGNNFDFDLGCPENDYLGTDVDRDMLYVYNSTEEDECDSASTNLDPDQFGVSVLKGLIAPFLIVNIDGEDTLIPPPFGSGIADTLINIRMGTSIIPVNCADSSNSNACDPVVDTDFFNLLMGLNTDGTPILDNNGNPTTKMFSGNGNDPNGWSMCNETVNPQTIGLITTGPGMLQPGAKNELVLAMFHAKSNPGCNRLAKIQLKHDQIADFFNNDFFHNVGPPPPRIEMSNNPDGILLSILDVPLDYSESFFVEELGSHERYNFEGIKIYQVRSENFDLTELDNIDLSRLIYQGDIENGVDELFNWFPYPNPNPQVDEIVWVPQRAIDGEDIGIVDELLFDRDAFTNLSLIPGKEYYFVAVSYGYNNYMQYDVIDDEGQKYPYLESTCRIKVINSETLLSSNEILAEQNYTFESFGQQWQINNIKSDLQIRLLSSSGQLIDKRNLKRGDTFGSEMTDELPSGVYFLRVLGENNKSAKVHKVYKAN